MSLRLPDHTPATLGDVRAVSLAALLAQAETPCTSGCSEGTIWNVEARKAWRVEHAETLEAFQQERRRTRSAVVKPDEKALLDTEPPMYFDCACNGTGFILTADGQVLLDFLTRHQVVRASGRYVAEPGPHILPLNETGGMP